MNRKRQNHNNPHVHKDPEVAKSAVTKLTEAKTEIGAKVPELSILDGMCVCGLCVCMCVRMCGCFFLHLFFTLYVMFVTKNDVVV